MLVRVEVTWGLTRSWEDLILRWPIHGVVGKTLNFWFLAEGLNSSPSGRLQRAAWASSWHGYWLPPEDVMQESEEGGIQNVFLTLVLEVMHCYSCHILVSRGINRGMSISPSRIWGWREITAHLFFFFSMLGMGPRVSCMLGKHSIIHLYSKTVLHLLKGGSIKEFLNIFLNYYSYSSPKWYYVYKSI
jgi:hypothetical protein